MNPDAESTFIRFESKSEVQKIIWIGKDHLHGVWERKLRQVYLSTTFTKKARPLCTRIWAALILGLLVAIHVNVLLYCKETYLRQPHPFSYSISSTSRPWRDPRSSYHTRFQKRFCGKSKLTVTCWQDVGQSTAYRPHADRKKNFLLRPLRAR